jgi:hypothetical protein
LSEAQAASTFDGIGTDSVVRAPTLEHFRGNVADVADVEDRRSTEWNEASFMLATGIMVVKADQLPYRHDWETAFETTPKNRKMETTYMYGGAIADMDVKKVVCIRDLVGNELCISSNSGQKVFSNLRSAISQGNKVCISFENIKSLSPAFIESAIGQLYNGNIQGNIDEKLSFVNISPGRKLIVDEVIREAKEYYSDPAGYTEKMKELFADD